MAEATILQDFHILIGSRYKGLHVYVVITPNIIFLTRGIFFYIFLEIHIQKE